MKNDYQFEYLYNEDTLNSRKNDHAEYAGEYGIFALLPILIECAFFFWLLSKLSLILASIPVLFFLYCIPRYFYYKKVYKQLHANDKKLTATQQKKLEEKKQNTFGQPIFKKRKFFHFRKMKKGEDFFLFFQEIASKNKITFFVGELILSCLFVGLIFLYGQFIPKYMVFFVCLQFMYWLLLIGLHKDTEYTDSRNKLGFLGICFTDLFGKLFILYLCL